MVETIKKFTKDAYQDEERIGERNANLMQEDADEMLLHAKCAICGENDLVMSEIILKANYGSRHDGDIIKLYVCSNCFDGVVGEFLQERS